MLLIDNAGKDDNVIDGSVVEVINNCTVILNIELDDINKNIVCMLYKISKISVETAEGVEAKKRLEAILPINSQVKIKFNVERRKCSIPNCYLVTLYKDKYNDSINSCLLLDKKFTIASYQHYNYCSSCFKHLNQT